MKRWKVGAVFLMAVWHGPLMVAEILAEGERSEFFMVYAASPTSIISKGETYLPKEVLRGRLEREFQVQVQGQLRKSENVPFRARYTMWLKNLEEPECVEIEKEVFLIEGGKERCVGRYRAILDVHRNKVKYISSRPEEKEPQVSEEAVKRPLIPMFALGKYCEGFLARAEREATVQLLVAPNVGGFRIFSCGLTRGEEGKFTRPGEIEQFGRRVLVRPDLGFFTFLAPTVSLWHEAKPPFRFLASHQPGILWLPEAWTYSRPVSSARVVPQQ